MMSVKPLMTFGVFGFQVLEEPREDRSFSLDTSSIADGMSELGVFCSSGDERVQDLCCLAVVSRCGFGLQPESFSVRCKKLA